MRIYKKLLIVVVLGFVLLPLSSCNIITSFINEQINGYHVDWQHRFAIKFPKNWQILPNYKKTNVISRSPMENSNDKVFENVVVTSETIPRGLFLSKYVEVSIKNMKKLLINMKILEKNDAIINKLKTKWFVVTHEMHGLTFKVLMYFFINNERAYVVTCTATTESFDRYRKLFESIVSTFYAF